MDARIITCHCVHRYMDFPFLVTTPILSQWIPSYWLKLWCQGMVLLYGLHLSHANDRAVIPRCTVASKPKKWNPFRIDPTCIFPNAFVRWVAANVMNGAASFYASPSLLLKCPNLNDEGKRRRRYVIDSQLATNTRLSRCKAQCLCSCIKRDQKSMTHEPFEFLPAAHARIPTQYTRPHSHTYTPFRRAPSPTIVWNAAHNCSFF